MNFLYPAFLLGALAVAIPIALHFLRREVAPEVPFSAVRLLRRSPVARSRRRRLRDLLLLAARIAALLLLAAAFARPYIVGATGSPSILIIAVDRSFSMGAPGRFASAIDLARRAVDASRPGERVAILAFDDRTDTIAPPGSPAAARAALDGLEPGFGATRYAALLAKAADIAGPDGGRLVVVTDLQRSGWDGEDRAVLPSGLVLEVKDAGALPDNLSVAAVRIAGDRVIVSIGNSGRIARTGQVQVERDGNRAAAASYAVPPGSSVEVPIAYRAPASGSIAVSIDDAAGLAADNRRFVVLDPVSPQTILLVTSGASESGFYLARALGAAGNGMETRVTPSPSMPAGDLSSYSAVVLLSTRGLERRSRELIAAFVRSGGGLLIAPSSDVEPVVLSAIFNWGEGMAGTVEAAGAVAWAPTDLRHPIFRPFGALAANLGQVRFERAWRLDTEGWDVAARFTNGHAALLERREGKGRVVLFASDLDRRWNDFPLHPAFVPFAVEAVHYVSGPRDRSRDYVVGSVPDGVAARPGVYHTNTGNRLVAVNVEARESTADVMTPGEFTGMVERVSADRAAADPRARQIEARQGYWQYGLLLMLAALVAESFVGRG